MAQNATRFGERFGNDDLSPVEVEAGQVYETLSGERVEVVEDDRRGDKPLLLRYPDRPEANQEVRMSRYSFADAANYEGYRLVEEADEETPEESHMSGEFADGPISCPVCSRFMSTGYDGQGFPLARCSRADCLGVLDVDELLDRGLWTETNA